MTYDLFIIGGGVNGCGIARDASGRGLSFLQSKAIWRQALHPHPPSSFMAVFDISNTMNSDWCARR
jgi:hypothetical protein